MNKKYAFLLLPAVAVAAAGITVAAQTSAHWGNSNQVEELAEKLNVEEAQLKAAFEEIKQEHKAEKEAQSEEKREGRRERVQERYEQRLDEAVQDGELTEAQKQLILNKRSELIAKFDAEKAALQTWLEQNNIDLKYLGIGHGVFRGPWGFHRDFWEFPKLQEKSDD